MIRIKPVSTRGDMRRFIGFPKELYKDNPYWVPALEGDEYDAFNPKKNKAFAFCEAQPFLALRDGKVVGRVAAILNRRANEQWGPGTVRYGWLDFIEDAEVLSALTGAVAEWGKERGCTTVIGPFGFTDMDPEGSLVEGFDKMCPFTCIYNYPYYDRMLKEQGFEKQVDWIQRSMPITPEFPAMFQFAGQIEQRFGLHVVKGMSMRQMVKRYGDGIFEAYNKAFEPLYGFSPLDPGQVKKYLSTYAAILNPEYIAVCVNSEDKPVGFIACVPTLSKAIRKSGGRLLPFGFIRILRAARFNETVEALIMGVDPEYQGSGAILLMLKYLHENFLRLGVKQILLNPQLESNTKAVTLFDQYDTTLYMRRRAYKKSI